MEIFKFYMERAVRVGHRDFAMGGDMSPPIGGVQMGGDKAYLGGDLRVNFATFFKERILLKMAF